MRTFVISVYPRVSGQLCVTNACEQNLAIVSVFETTFEDTVCAHQVKDEFESARCLQEGMGFMVNDLF